jgi:hypothetical protein
LCKWWTSFVIENKEKHCYCKNDFEEEMNNPLKEKIERQLVKKISNPFVIVFFLLPNISKNIICNKQCFFEDMGLLIVKNHLPIQFETFMFTFVSKTCLSFQKTVFT